MGWTHIPDPICVPLPTNNPYGEVPTEEVINLKLPRDEWLLKRLKAVNTTVSKGYPSKNRENDPLLAQKLVKAARCVQYYNMHNPHESEKPSVIKSLPDGPEHWGAVPARLNALYNRISKLQKPSPKPSSAQVLPQFHMKLCASRRGGFARCITRLQKHVGKNIKTLTSIHNKGKAPFSRGTQSLEEFQSNFTFLSKLQDH